MKTKTGCGSEFGSVAPHPLGALSAPLVGSPGTVTAIDSILNIG